MDNCLYLWDYTVQNPELIGYEENPHPITAVKLVRPKLGVFVQGITHLLVVATSETMLLLGLSVQTTQTGAKTVQLYNTRIWIHTKGLNTQITASPKTGRIFFLDAGKKICTSSTTNKKKAGSAANAPGSATQRPNYDFLPRPVKAVTSLFGPNQAHKKLVRLALNDTRDLLYTLSDTSEIKVWLILNGQSLGHFTGPSELLYSRDVRLVDLSVISATEGGKLNLMATTNTGCRLYLSAMRAGYGLPDAQNPPSSMQVLHVRFPPRDPHHQQQPQQQQQQKGSTQYSSSNSQQGSGDTVSRTLTPTDAAFRLPPGHFLAFHNPNPQLSRRERVFCSAPDYARLKCGDANLTATRFVEFGQWIELPGGHSTVESKAHELRDWIQRGPPEARKMGHDIEAGGAWGGRLVELQRHATAYSRKKCRVQVRAEQAEGGGGAVEC
ncbi:hypothetical protein LTR22_022144 [Elasticomyces elasticus]|nr:hypothetical protein LTR22_022144 [Elasticomyces elasticus]